MKHDLLQAVNEDEITAKPKNIVIQQYQDIRQIKATQLLKTTKSVLSELDSIRKYVQFDINNVEDLDARQEYLDGLKEGIASMHAPEQMKDKVKIDKAFNKSKINPAIRESYNKRGPKKKELVYVDTNTLKSKDLSLALKISHNDAIWGSIAAIRWPEVRQMAQKVDWSIEDLDKLKKQYMLATSAWTCKGCNSIKLEELFECPGNANQIQ